MVGGEEDRFARYERPTLGGEEMVYQQPGPLDKAKEFAPVLKQNAKKIIIAIIVIAAIYFLLDFFVLSNRQFTIKITDTEGTAIPINSINVYTGSDSKPFFSGRNQSNYIVSMKPAEYRFEVSAGSNYKVFSKTITANADSLEIIVKMEKDMRIEITAFNFPTELYLGQETEASVSLANNSEQTENVQLVFEGDLKAFGQNIYSEPATITLLGNQPATATIKIKVPTNISIKDTKKGDSKKAVVRIKYLNEKSSEQAFTLYPQPLFEVSPKSISTDVVADGDNKPVRDIIVENKGTFPLKNVSIRVDAEDEAIENWFSFQPDSKTDLIDAKGSQQNKWVVKLWIRVPIGTEQENLSPNIVVSTVGAEKTVPIVLEIKPAKLDFIATASKDTINIPKENGGYKELIGEYIKLQNKGLVDIENIDLSTDVACRDSWITFPQGSHVDKVRKGSIEEVAMRITAPQSAEPNKSVSCQITVRYDDPVDPSNKKQQVVSLFLVPKT